MRMLSIFATAVSLIAAVAGYDLSNDGGDRSSAGTEPLRVMIVGDSITHGNEGDYTWRYRIWEWFRANNVSVEFVGPYTGTVHHGEPKPPQPPPVLESLPPALFSNPRVAWGYSQDVSKDFDAHHYATSGYRANLVALEVRDLVKEYTPDLLLCLIGINDFIWFGEEPEGLMTSMKIIVDEVRIANPRAKLAISNLLWTVGKIPRLEERTAEYNTLLRAAIPTWSTEESPIHHVDAGAAYSCGPNDPECSAAFDGLHPNTLGEYQIARAFAQSLIDDFSLGHDPLDIPAVLPENRQYLPPTNVRAEGSPMGVKLTWDRHYGMTSYEVQWRWKYPEGQKWNKEVKQKTRMDSETPSAGITIQYKVCSCHGNRCSEYSEIVEGVSERHTAPPPTNLRITSLETAFQLDWAPPENSSDWNITQYELSVKEVNGTFYKSLGSLRFSEVFSGFSQSYPGVISYKSLPGIYVPPTGLRKGSIWQARLATWTEPEGRGFYEEARPVMIGGGKPTQPQNLQARYTSFTSANLTWNATDAAGYLLYTRNLAEGINSTLQTDGKIIMGSPQKLVRNLVHGRGEYEFCVTAVNGDDESPMSECVIPGISNIGIMPADWMREMSIYPTAWFCALLLAAVFITASRRRREPPGILQGIEFMEEQRPKDYRRFSKQHSELPLHDRID